MSNLQVIKLKEIKKALNENSLSSVEHLSAQINDILKNFTSLENTRLCVQQLFETETIKLCAVKHKLVEFGQKKLRELKVRKQEVQKMNEGDIKEQKDNLQHRLTEVALLQAKSDAFAKEMSELRSTEASLVAENEKRIADLNQCLGTRAQRQTYLNELREATYESDKKRDEALAKLTQLKDELNKERIDKRRRIVKIESDLNNIRKQTQLQCRKNEELVGPYNEASSASNNANTQLQAVSAKLTKQREMLHDLEGQQEQLTREVDRIHTELESANAQKASVVSKLQELERSHKTTMDGLSKKTKELEDQERDLNMEITASNEKLVWLKQSSEEADKEYTKWSAQVRHGRQEAKKMDHELLKVLTTIGQLEEEVQRMHEEIRTTVETNQNLITTYKAQLEKMQVQLGSEQKQRVEAQRKKRQLTRQMDVFREAHVKFLRNVQRNIARLKNTGSKTESEMKRLNEEIESSQRCTNETVFHMEELKEEIEKESQKLLDRIGNARKQVAEVEDEVKQTKDHIDEEEPGYETVKQVLAKRTEFYGRLREQQTQLTLELKTLGQQVTRKTAANSTLSGKVLEARNRLSTRMSNNKTQLVSESNLLSDLEKQIYMNGCRLKTVLIENARLFWGIQDQENEMRQVCSHWERLLRSKSMVQSEVNNAYEIVKHCQDKEENEMKTTLAVWKENNMQCGQMKSLTVPVRKALAEALDILL